MPQRITNDEGIRRYNKARTDRKGGQDNRKEAAHEAGFCASNISSGSSPLAREIL